MSAVSYLRDSGEPQRMMVSQPVRAWIERTQRAQSEGALTVDDLIEQILSCIGLLFDGVIDGQQALMVEMLFLMIRNTHAASSAEGSPDDAMLPLSQAALEIGAHVSSVRQAAQAGRISAVKRGRHWYVRRGDLGVVRPRARSLDSTSRC